MDATDLDSRARTQSGCIPPELASRLLERGRADVVEAQAGRGQWFCALAWARALADRGREADAWEVLAPYVATGRWTAVVGAAGVLEGWGRVDEAIDITRKRMEAGHPKPWTPTRGCSPGTAAPGRRSTCSCRMSTTG
ncbi:hypothetical protein [Embleya sp. NPDC005971]|uniref:hypothetical protein n=1 Tax=Embleya sp. NPDC005971 TaxID=3156724 RepID=UPI0033C57C94